MRGDELDATKPGAAVDTAPAPVHATPVDSMGRDGVLWRRYFLWAAGAVIGLQVVAGLLIYLAGFYLGGDEWQYRGQFGDMFGVVNALFSGLAFAGVIIAIILQNKELLLQHEAEASSRRALEDQVRLLERSLKSDTQINTAKFWLELRSMFARHEEVHKKLRPGGAWTKSGNENLPKVGSDEEADLIAYMGLFEHCEFMLQKGLIDEETFKKIYAYRLDALVRNNRANGKLTKSKQRKLGSPDSQGGWDALHRLLDRFDKPLLTPEQQRVTNFAKKLNEGKTQRRVTTFAKKLKDS